MAKKITAVVKLQLPAGKATPAPPENAPATGLPAADKGGKTYYTCCVIKKQDGKLLFHPVPFFTDHPRLSFIK